MRNQLILLFALLMLSSCQRVLFTLYGIKQPDVENERSIKKKARKFDLDTSNIVTVNSKDFLHVLKGQGIPNGAVYDRYGKYIEYRKTDTSCNAGLFQFIPALNTKDRYQQPDSAGLLTELGKFRDLRGNALPPTEPADFYVLLYWTVWTGRLNKDHVKIWEDLARNNKNSNIQIIKVNLDLQEYWSESDRARIIKAISKKK